MNKLMKLFFFLFLLNAVIYCSKLEWTGDEFEVKSLLDASSNSSPQIRTLLCESCQLITFALKNYISSELSVYKNSTPPRGLTDIIVSNFLESHVACSNHVWQPLADNSLNFSIEDFISSCRENLSRWEAELEVFATKKMSLQEGIEYVCLGTESCEKSGLWNENEYPENRESKTIILKRRSEEFLLKNKNRDGVTTTSSGLQYMVLKKGDGKNKPTLEDEVEVQYRGKTLGGIEFDSSFNRGNEPTKMGVSQLIPGWIEALTLMSEGEELLLFIPPELAYGEKGAGELIGPNEAIVFKLRLVKVIKKMEKSIDDVQRSEL